MVFGITVEKRELKNNESQLLRCKNAEDEDEEDAKEEVKKSRWILSALMLV